MQQMLVDQGGGVRRIVGGDGVTIGECSSTAQATALVLRWVSSTSGMREISSSRKRASTSLPAMPASRRWNSMDCCSPVRASFAS